MTRERSLFSWVFFIVIVLVFIDNPMVFSSEKAAINIGASYIGFIGLAMGSARQGLYARANICMPGNIQMVNELFSAPPMFGIM